MKAANDRLVLLLLAAALCGCEGHGKYTSEFLDQATKEMAHLRAATQYDLAVQQFESGDLERALLTAESTIALDPDVGKAHLLKARILLELGRTEQALAALDRGALLDPGDKQFRYYRAIALERVGRLEESLAEYRAAAAMDAGSPQYLLAAAEILIDLERLDEAREELTGHGGDLGSDAGVRQALGHIALLKGDIDAALRAFTEAAVLSPGDAVLLEDLCQAQIAAGRFAQAELTLRRLSQDGAAADRPDLKHLHASCLLELDRPVEARSILYQLVRAEHGSADVEAWVKLVDVALLLRDDGLLRSAANRLMAVAPGRPEGYLALAIWQQRNHDLKGALRSVQRAVDRAGGDPTPARLQATIQRQLGDDGKGG